MDIKPFRFLLDARDRSVVEWDLPIDSPGRALTVILWDADRDLRLLTVLEALRYRSPMLLATLTAVSESRGSIDVWGPACMEPTVLVRALQGAADAALRPHDQWRVNAPTLITVRDDRLDWTSLPPNDPLRIATTRHLGPKYQQLGMADAKDGSARSDVRS